MTRRKPKPAYTPGYFTELMRYLRKLADRDLALDRAMIPLGSCTMKLNATAEMIPVTWPEFGNLHPFCPPEQAEGYCALFDDLERWLVEITGYDAVSLQPNSGAQGEYAGLLTILAYHRARGDADRTICLIPVSAHGTNPASAQMAGMKVVVVKSAPNGDVDLEDFRDKAAAAGDRLAVVSFTPPASSGGPPITSYTATCGTQSGTGLSVQKVLVLTVDQAAEPVINNGSLPTGTQL